MVTQIFQSVLEKTVKVRVTWLSLCNCFYKTFKILESKRNRTKCIKKNIQIFRANSKLPEQSSWLQDEKAETTQVVQSLAYNFCTTSVLK